MDKEIMAASHAVMQKLEYMTNDRINAMGGSNGTLNIVTLSMMDICVDEILKGTNINISFKNTKEIDIERVIKRMLETADYYRVDKANAAFLTALILYFAGSDPRAGVPAGNRKLGAMTRILAGVPRGSVATIPSPKLGNKVSGFAAVLAIYETLAQEGLTSINGKNIPFGTIGTLYMHSILGEDIVIPEVVEKGTKAAVLAMDKAMSGMAMMMYDGMASKISAALLGSAAMLEMVHPDANAYYEGTYIPSSHMVGKIAAKTLGIPDTLHLHILNKEYDSGQLIGDIALLIKDSGNISVVCMLGLADIFAMFQEWLVWTGGPTITPIASLGGEAWIAMQALIQEDGDINKVGEILSKARDNWFDPELSKIALNIVASKALEYYQGAVSNSLVLATEASKIWAVQKRTNITYSMYAEGHNVSDVVFHLENIRKVRVEKNCAAFCSTFFNRKVQIEVKRVEPLGRIAKKGEGIGKFWALDPDVDVLVTLDGKEYNIDRLCEIGIPKVTKGDYTDENYKIAVECAAIFIQELSYSGVMLFNVTVPVAVATAMNKGTIKDICNMATKTAFITGNIPGTLLKCTKVAQTTQMLMKNYVDYE